MGDFSTDNETLRVPTRLPSSRMQCNYESYARLTWSGMRRSRPSTVGAGNNGKLEAMKKEENSPDHGQTEPSLAEIVSGEPTERSYRHMQHLRDVSGRRRLWRCCLGQIARSESARQQHKQLVDHRKTEKI
jgi:hypothetical protein